MTRVRLPSGEIVEFPATMSDDAIAAAIKAMDPPPPAEEPSAPGVPYGVQAAARTLRGAGDTFTNLVTNLAGFGATPERKAEIEEYRQGQDELYDKIAPDAGEGWEMFGGALSGLGAGASLRGASTLGQKGLTMAAEGGLFGATAEAEDEAALAQNVGIGAAVAPVIPGIGKAIAGAYRGLPGLVNRMAPMSKKGIEADQFARQRGVPVRGEDVIDSGFIRGSGRQIDALDMTNTRRNDLNKYEAALREDLDDPRDLDTMIGELGASYKTTYQALKNKKQELYKNAYSSTSRLGDMDPRQTQETLLNMYDEQVKAFGKDSPGAKEIEKWFDYEPGNVETWHNRLKDVSRKIRQAERATDPNTVDANIYRNIKKAISADLDAFTGDNREWQVAQDFYKKNIVPYREDAFKNLIRKGDTEKAATQAVDTAKTTQTKKAADSYWSSLDHDGRATYKEALFSKMLDNAADTEIGFSPAKTASYLDATEQRLAQKYITPDERKALSGWQNLMRYSQFAGESAARSRTGASVLQSGALTGGASVSGATVGALVGGPAGAALGGAIGASLPLIPGLIARSPKVRNMLAKLSTMKPDHPDYDTVIFDTLAAIGAATSAKAASDAVGDR